MIQALWRPYNDNTRYFLERHHLVSIPIIKHHLGGNTFSFWLSGWYAQGSCRPSLPRTSRNDNKEPKKTKPNVHLFVTICLVANTPAQIQKTTYQKINGNHCLTFSLVSGRPNLEGVGGDQPLASSLPPHCLLTRLLTRSRLVSSSPAGNNNNSKTCLILLSLGWYAETLYTQWLCSLV